MHEKENTSEWEAPSLNVCCGRMGRSKKARFTHTLRSKDQILSSSSSSGEKSECGEETASTRSLSDDMLLHILHFIDTRSLLSSAALVCRRWRRLCSSHLVRELVPSLFGSDEKPWGSLREKDIMRLAWCHASTLEKLCLHGLKHLRGDQIVPLIQSLPKLKDLAIVSCPLLVSSDIEDIARALPSDLETFDLHVDHLLGFPIPPLLYDSFTTSFQKQHSNLGKLDLDTDSYITPEGLSSLLVAFPTLHSLDLHSHLIGWAEVKMIFRKCKCLVHFSLVSRRLTDDLSSSDEEDEPGILRRRRLNMHGHNRNIELSVSLCSVVPPSLKSLRLHSFRNHSVPMDSPPVASLLKESGHRLRHLYAQSLFNTSWHTISVWCANLQTLDLSHARDKVLITTGIEEVVLCGIPRLLRCLVRIALPSVSDHILVEFGRFCSKLKEIRFEGYGSANSSVSLLHGTVTDRGVVALAEGCSNLQVLSLAGSNVTIASLRALSFHCRGIKALYMNRCDLLKDDATRLIWTRMCDRLQLLDLGGCSKITASSIKHFMQHVQMYGTSLRVLAIPRSLCNSSKTEISKLKELTPFLRIRASSFGIPWEGFQHSYTSQL